MKTIILSAIFQFAFFLTSVGQINLYSKYGEEGKWVESQHRTYMKSLYMKGRDSLLSSKMIFVLPDTYDKAVYKSVLQNAWTVTDFDVVYFKNFSIKDYLTENYSFCTLEINQSIRSLEDGPSDPSSVNIQSMYAYFKFSHFDEISARKDLSELESKKEKMGSKKYKKRERLIISWATKPFAKTYFCLKGTLVNDIKGNKVPVDGSRANYIANSLYNYNLVTLKNYVQKVNALIERNTGWAMTGKRKSTSEIKLLKDKTLYVPDYFAIKWNPFTWMDSKPDINFIHKVFSNYGFDYKVISQKELERKVIQDNEMIYYLKMCRFSSNLILEIVNSKTGEIIYRHYRGTTYNVSKGLVNNIKRDIN